jgi:hypothetical protein
MENWSTRRENNEQSGWMPFASFITCCERNTFSGGNCLPGSVLGYKTVSMVELMPSWHFASLASVQFSIPMQAWQKISKPFNRCVPTLFPWDSWEMSPSFLQNVSKVQKGHCTFHKSVQTHLIEMKTAARFDFSRSFTPRLGHLYPLPTTNKSKYLHFRNVWYKWVLERHERRN